MEAATKYFYAVIDEKSICIDVIEMQFPLSGANYIEIDSLDKGLIGKRWNGTGWEDVTIFYYAVLDEKGIVRSVMEQDKELPATPELVQITFEQFNDPDIIGKWYDEKNKVFIEPPVSIVKEHSTDEIQYKGEEKWLSQKLDEMEEAIKNAGGGTPIEGHTHTNKEVLDGITAEKVAAWDAGTGEGTPIDAYTKEESDAKYAPVGASYTKEESDAKYALAGSTGSTMTAEEILTALKTVDGANSGLDADTLDGMDSKDIATKAELNGKANASHNHAMDEVTGLEDALAGKAPSVHTHTDYATKSHTHEQSEVAGLSNVLSGMAPKNHTHNEYAPTTHNHNGYAPTDHDHNMNDIYGLALSLAEKANANHSHSGYASSSHNHSNETLDLYLLRLGGQQAIYNSGSMMTLGTNNLETMIAGSKIYSKTQISVSSDERLKENIEEADCEALVNLIKAIKVKNFNYIGSDDECVGLIAQDVVAANKELAKYFVRTDSEGYLSVKIADLVFPLIASVQALQKEIEELKK